MDLQKGTRPAMNQTLITLASKNTGKLYELRHWLAQCPLPVELAVNPDAPEIEETGEDFVQNAILKARQTPPVPGSHLVLAEDSGMAVEALDGSYGLHPFPGLKSNRWMTPAVREELLGIPDDHPVTNDELCIGVLMLMEGRGNRQADYRCGMALWDAGKGLVFSTLEKTELMIIESRPRGENGFGYDPITMPVIEGRAIGRTTAELETAEKNAISHRGKAFRKVLDFLQSVRA